MERLEGLEAKIVARGQRSSSSSQSARLRAASSDRLDHQPAVGERRELAGPAEPRERSLAGGGAELLLGDQPIERGADLRLPAPQGRLAHVPHHDGEAGKGGRLSDAAAHEACSGDADSVEGQEVDQAGRSRREPSPAAGSLFQVVERPLQAELDPRGHRSVSLERHVAET